MKKNSWLLIQIPLKVKVMPSLMAIGTLTLTQCESSDIARRNGSTTQWHFCFCLFILEVGFFRLSVHLVIHRVIYVSANIFIPYYTGQVIANVFASKSYEQLLRCVVIITALSIIV